MATGTGIMALRAVGVAKEAFGKGIIEMRHNN